MAALGQDRDGLTRNVALAKDLFSLLRDAVLFFGLAMLLLFPVALNRILNSAGIVELNAGFAVWKNSLVRTDDKLKVANDTITAMRATQDKLLAALAARESGRPIDQERVVAAARASVRTNEAAAQQVQQSVRATLRSNASLIARETGTAAAAPAAPGICYQESDPRAPAARRYSVHCHATRALCETARGPNPRTRQTACTPTAIGDAGWSPSRGGFLGAWYEYRGEPFPAPFPALPPG